jgi:hypothetical protein
VGMEGQLVTQGRLIVREWLWRGTQGEFGAFSCWRGWHGARGVWGAGGFQTGGARSGAREASGLSRHISGDVRQLELIGL